MLPQTRGLGPTTGFGGTREDPEPVDEAMPNGGGGSPKRAATKAVANIPLSSSYSYTSEEEVEVEVEEPAPEKEPEEIGSGASSPPLPAPARRSHRETNTTGGGSSQGVDGEEWRQWRHAQSATRRRVRHGAPPASLEPVPGLKALQVC